MLEAKTKHVFSAEAEPIFKRKLGEFHERTDSRLVMCGVDLIGVDMQTVKMSKMPGYDHKFCQKIMGGFLEFQPDIHVVLMDDEQGKSFECVFIHLHDQHSDEQYYINNVYMIQNAYHYPQHDKCLYQLWNIHHSHTVKDINTFWNA